jgi:hypothetical protein
MFSRLRRAPKALTLKSGIWPFRRTLRLGEDLGILQVKGPSHRATAIPFSEIRSLE